MVIMRQELSQTGIAQPSSQTSCFKMICSLVFLHTLCIWAQNWDVPWVKCSVSSRISKGSPNEATTMPTSAKELSSFKHIFLHSLIYCDTQGDTGQEDFGSEPFRRWTTSKAEIQLKSSIHRQMYGWFTWNEEEKKMLIIINKNWHKSCKTIPSTSRTKNKKKSVTSHLSHEKSSSRQRQEQNSWIIIASFTITKDREREKKIKEPNKLNDLTILTQLSKQ